MDSSSSSSATTTYRGSADRPHRGVRLLHRSREAQKLPTGTFKHRDIDTDHLDAYSNYGDKCFFSAAADPKL